MNEEKFLPKFIYDSDCGICVASVNFLSSRVKKINFISFTEYSESKQKPNITYEEAQRGSYLIRDKGDTAFDADAVIGAIEHGKFSLKATAKFLKFPPFLRFSREVYSWIAINRRFLSAFPSACGLNEPVSMKSQNSTKFKPSYFFYVLMVFLIGEFLVPVALMALRFSGISPLALAHTLST